MPRGRKTKTEPVVEEKAVPTEPVTPNPKTAAPRKKPAKKVEKVVTESIILQSAGVEWNVGSVKEKVIAAYVAEGHRRGRISDLTVYLKPEERKAYYVINGKITGSIDVD